MPSNLGYQMVKQSRSWRLLFHQVSRSAFGCFWSTQRTWNDETIFSSSVSVGCTLLFGVAQGNCCWHFASVAAKLWAWFPVPWTKDSIVSAVCCSDVSVWCVSPHRDWVSFLLHGFFGLASIHAELVRICHGAIGDASPRLDSEHKTWTSKAFKTQRISDLNTVTMDCANFEKGDASVKTRWPRNNFNVCWHGEWHQSDFFMDPPMILWHHQNFPTSCVLGLWWWLCVLAFGLLHFVSSLFESKVATCFASAISRKLCVSGRKLVKALQTVHH